MTLDEAIKHAEEVAEKQEKAAKEWHENQVRKCKLIPFAEMDYTHENECEECAVEHRQLEEWLKELKQLREQQSVLDKIRAEIEQLTITEGGYNYTRKMAELYSLKIKVLQIIDKYKAESKK